MNHFVQFSTDSASLFDTNWYAPRTSPLALVTSICALVLGYYMVGRGTPSLRSLDWADPCFEEVKAQPIAPFQMHTLGWGKIAESKISVIDMHVEYRFPMPGWDTPRPNY